jgi:hypothetical protein
VEAGLTLYTPTHSLTTVILPTKTRHQVSPALAPGIRGRHALTLTLPRGQVEEALEGLRAYWDLQKKSVLMTGDRTEPLRDLPKRGATMFLVSGRPGCGKKMLAEGIAFELRKKVGAYPPGQSPT